MTRKRKRLDDMLAKFDNQLVSGISLAALMAAGMSSLAAVILIVGTALVNDLWDVCRPMPAKKIISRTRATMIIYCFIVYGVTVYPPAGVVDPAKLVAMLVWVTETLCL